MLYDINNRGRRLWGAQPFFLRHGYVTVWSGWIAQVRAEPPLLRLEAPVALGEDGVPITGTVRAELLTDVATERLTVSDRGQLAFEPVVDELPRATLTRRLRERDAPEIIPRDRWEFVLTRGPHEESSGLIEGAIELEGGFDAGVIYELIYEARGSVVQGAGFAAIRDLVSFLRHDDSSMNPLRDASGQPLASRVIGEGRSQSGRALRMFLYEGFNADEQGRIVFDGVLPVISGGGQGFFNHRFASPTRTATEHSGHLYPVDVFPFAYGEQTDPFTGRTDSLLRRARASGTAPKVMHLDTSSEYWHRSGSLVVTDPTGQRDSEIPDDVRVYVFGGSQHSPARGPSDRGQLAPNPNVYQPFLEALFLAMDRWVTGGAPPPPSRHPRIADGTLVGWQADKAGWTPLPGRSIPHGDSGAGPPRLWRRVRDEASDRAPSAGPIRRAVSRARAAARRRQQRSRRAAHAGRRGSGRHLHRLEPAASGDRGARRAARARRRHHRVSEDEGRPRGVRRSAPGGSGALRQLRGVSRRDDARRRGAGRGRLPARRAPRGHRGAGRGQPRPVRQVAGSGMSAAADVFPSVAAVTAADGWR